MTRVLRIINRFNLGGPTYNAAYLTRHLPDRFETLLIGGVPQESEESSTHILKSVGVEGLVLPEMQRAINPRGDFEAYKKIRSIIREFKPDIVHTHASKAGFLGRMAARKENVEHVVHTFHGHVFHSYFPPWKTAIYKNLERYLAKGTDAIIAISPLQKEELVNKHRICKGDKVHIIPLGFDLERFRQNQEENRTLFRNRYGIKENQIVVGIIGRLVPIKDHRLFLEAFAMAYSRNRQLRAVIVGDGESKSDLLSFAEELELGVQEVEGASEHPVIFTSWIKEVDKALPGMDIVALSSLNEGTPVSLIEAQAAGKPIVSTEVGGVADVVLREKTGFLSPVGDSAAFAESLIKLGESSELRRSMGEGGWQHVEGRFSVKRLVNDITSLYDGLLKP